MDTSTVERQALSVLAKLRLQSVHLRTEQTVLVVRGIRSLLEILHLCLEVFEMLLLALPKGALGRSILGFAFLMMSDTYVTRHTDTTYGCGLRG